MTSPTRLDAVGAVLAMLRRVPDPRERITAIRLVRAELTRHDERLVEMLRDTILDARALDPPATWQEIGDLLEVTAQRAHQLVAERFTNRNTTTTKGTQ